MVPSVGQSFQFQQKATLYYPNLIIGAVCCIGLAAPRAHYDRAPSRHRCVAPRRQLSMVLGDCDHRATAGAQTRPGEDYPSKNRAVAALFAKVSVMVWAEVGKRSIVRKVCGSSPGVRARDGASDQRYQKGCPQAGPQLRPRALRQGAEERPRCSGRAGVARAASRYWLRWPSVPYHLGALAGRQPTRERQDGGRRRGTLPI